MPDKLSVADTPAVVGDVIVPRLGMLTVITGLVESIIKLLSEKSLLILPDTSVAVTLTLAKLLLIEGRVQA